MVPSDYMGHFWSERVISSELGSGMSPPSSELDKSLNPITGADVNKSDIKHWMITCCPERKTRKYNEISLKQFDRFSCESHEAKSTNSETLPI